MLLFVRAPVTVVSSSHGRSLREPGVRVRPVSTFADRDAKKCAMTEGRIGLHIPPTRLVHNEA